MSKQSEEIFNDFMRRLQEKTAETKALDSYEHDEYPRMDSRSLKEIEKLYGVKPDMTYEYKDNIMEAAHPEPLVMFQAYDKMNALVENDIERQKIDLNILRRPVTGLEFRRKYANELMHALVAVANEMDFQDNDPLRKLADNTIEEFRKEALELSDIGDWLGEKFKTVEDVAGGATTGAAVGAVAGGLIGAFGGGPGILAGAWTGSRVGALAGGVLSAIFKTGPIARNVQENAKTAQHKLDSLMKDYPGDIFLTSLATELSHIQATANTYASLVDRMHTAGSPSDAAMASKVGQQYIAEIGKLDQMIGVFLANAKAGKYVSGSADWVEKLKSPFAGVFGDSLHDAINAFETLETVSHTARDSVLQAKQEVGSVAHEVSSAPSSGQTGDVDALQGYLSQFEGK